jgi:hypothetical protein
VLNRSHSSWLRLGWCPFQSRSAFKSSMGCRCHMTPRSRFEEMVQTDQLAFFHNQHLIPKITSLEVTTFSIDKPKKRRCWDPVEHDGAQKCKIGGVLLLRIFTSKCHPSTSPRPSRMTHLPRYIRYNWTSAQYARNGQIGVRGRQTAPNSSRVEFSWRKEAASRSAETLWPAVSRAGSKHR